MESEYVYEKLEPTRVPTAKATEPALMHLFEARHIREERESSFDRPWLMKEQIPEYIESVKEEINFRAESLRYQIYEIGRLLCDVKSLLPHGKFDPWVRANLPFSKASALNFMRVYKACMGIPGLVEYFNPSALYEISRQSFPKKLREELFANTTGTLDISQKELMEVAFKWKNGEVNLESPEVQNLLRKQRDKEVFKRYEIELRALKGLLDKRLRIIQSLNKRHIAHPLLKEQKDDHLYERCEKIEEMIIDFTVKVDEALDSLNPKKET